MGSKEDRHLKSRVSSNLAMHRMDGTCTIDRALPGLSEPSLAIRCS